MRKLELLSPAGDMERLEMAVAYGADAVYFAGTSFGMRSFAGNFSPEELPKAVRYAHDHGVRCHVTVNTMPRNDEIVRLPEYLEQLDDAGVDALIVRSPSPGNMPRTASGIFPPSNPSPITSAPRRGLIWARSGWCWHGNAVWKKSAPSVRR